MGAREHGCRANIGSVASIELRFAGPRRWLRLKAPMAQTWRSGSLNRLRLRSLRADRRIESHRAVWTCSQARNWSHQPNERSRASASDVLKTQLR